MTSINVPKDERLVKGWVGGLLDKKGEARAGRVGKFVEFEPKAKEELFLGLKVNFVILEYFYYKKGI